jgi:hypothetical protein
MTRRDEHEPWKHRYPRWEPVDASSVVPNIRIRTQRLSVPGGWLYKVSEYWDDEHFNISVCFVPDTKRHGESDD